MRKDLKDQHIDSLCEEIKAYPNLYIADIGGLNSVQTSKLRRAAFRKEGVFFSSNRFYPI